MSGQPATSFNSCVQNYKYMVLIITGNSRKYQLVKNYSKIHKGKLKELLVFHNLRLLKITHASFKIVKSHEFNFIFHLAAGFLDGVYN